VLSGEHSAHVCTRLSSSEEGRIPEAGVGKMGTLQRAVQFIVQSTRGVAPGTRSA
jgi:hypothetical protein